MADSGKTELRGLGSILDPRKSRLNLLIVALPVAVWLDYSGMHAEAFFASMVAIMPLACLMGKATEEISLRTGESIGGLLNATFGNAVELIIAGLAIWSVAQGTADEELMISLVQASLIGSILGNLLLVMGLAFLWGGIHHKEQKFSAEASNTNGSLLLLATIGLVIPASFAFFNDAEDIEQRVLSLSHWTALILITVYGLLMLFQLKTHVDLFASTAHKDEIEELSVRDSIILLVVSTLLVAWMAHILVGSVEHATTRFSLPTLFIGVILIPFFGNAAEHFTAVTVAAKDKMDLSIAISIGSSTQIALFTAPLMVLFGWAVGVGMPLQFGMFETVATIFAVLIANFIVQDGESNWLEGAMLLAAYAILAIAFYFY